MHRQTMAGGGGNGVVAGGSVVVRVACLAWCFCKRRRWALGSTAVGAQVVTPRYNDSGWVLGAVAVVSISPGSQRGGPWAGTVSVVV